MTWMIVAFLLLDSWPPVTSHRISYMFHSVSLFECFLFCCGCGDKVDHNEGHLPKALEKRLDGGDNWRAPPRAVVPIDHTLDA